VNALAKLTDIASLIRCRNATDDRTGYPVVQPYLARVAAVRSLADAVNVASEINELQQLAASVWWAYSLPKIQARWTS
jgi:hypothetical protein